MAQDKSIRQFALQVNTDVEALAEVLQWFEQKVTSLLPERLFWQCQLALAEGFTNTVRHAHQGCSAATPINLEIYIYPDCLEIRIWNWGKPFNLESRLQSQRCAKNAFLERESGRGLDLMQKLTDQLSYVRVESRNCLIMRKSFPSKPNTKLSNLINYF